MQTRFGKEAQNSDYVIVLDVDYVHRRAANYIAEENIKILIEEDIKIHNSKEENKNDKI
jgi:hypothetical protein